MTIAVLQVCLVLTPTSNTTQVVAGTGYHVINNGDVVTGTNRLSSVLIGNNSVVAFARKRRDSPRGTANIIITCPTGL